MYWWCVTFTAPPSKPGPGAAGSRAAGRAGSVHARGPLCALRVSAKNSTTPLSLGEVGRKGPEHKFILLSVVTLSCETFSAASRQLPCQATHRFDPANGVAYVAAEQHEEAADLDDEPEPRPTTQDDRDADEKAGRAAV